MRAECAVDRYPSQRRRSHRPRDGWIYGTVACQVTRRAVETGMRLVVDPPRALRYD